MMIRTDFHFFNDARGGELSSSGWAWPFSCLTASTWPMVPFGETFPIHEARIRWCYFSNHPRNGLRLVHFDNGPTNLRVIQTEWTTKTGSPQNEAHNVTADLQALQAAGGHKNLGYQYSVYGSNKLIIYRASLEIEWAIPVSAAT